MAAGGDGDKNERPRERKFREGGCCSVVVSENRTLFLSAGGNTTRGEAALRSGPKTGDERGEVALGSFARRLTTTVCTVKGYNTNLFN